ncbi:MAG TPA: hypothetical protein PKZ76_03290, partial [Xanthomonadaceae bacterium]|nr:hypothetical protein [Xanthomonadaceae bacterium]
NQEQLARALEWVARAREEDLRALNPQVRALDELQQITARQAQTLEGPAVRAAREYQYELARIAELEATLLELGPPTEETVLAIARAREQAAAILRQHTEEQEELGARGIEAADASARAWQQFGYDIVDAVARGAEGVKDLFKRMLQDLLKQIMASGITNAMSSLFNVGGAGAAGMAGGAGNIFTTM